MSAGLRTGTTTSTTRMMSRQEGEGSGIDAAACSNLGIIFPKFRCHVVDDQANQDDERVRVRSSPSVPFSAVRHRQVALTGRLLLPRRDSKQRRRARRNLHAGTSEREAAAQITTTWKVFQWNPWPDHMATFVQTTQAVSDSAVRFYSRWRSAYRALTRCSSFPFFLHSAERRVSRRC